MDVYVLTVGSTAIGVRINVLFWSDVYSHHHWRYVLAKWCLIMQIIGY
jgi:hypothetical protein